jgi:hypothetical protein
MTEEEVGVQVYMRLTKGVAGENKTNLFVANIISAFPECRRRFIQAMKASPMQEDKYYRVTNSLTVTSNSTSIAALLTGAEPILFEVPFIRVRETATGAIIQYYEDLTLLSTLPITIDGYAIEGTTMHLRKYSGVDAGNITLTTHKIPSVPNILEQHLDTFIDVCASYWREGQSRQ